MDKQIRYQIKPEVTLENSGDKIIRQIRLCLIFLLAIFGSSSSLDIVAAELTVDSKDQMEISRIKSAYLYNFLKYIDFPESEFQDEVTSKVCVLGEDPFGIALDGVAGRKAKGKTVIIQRLENLTQTLECHILYISGSEQKNLKSIFKKLSDQPVLTVSDIENFSQKGGMIGFISESDKISLEINLTNVNQVKIKISALLLEIARIVE